MSRVAYSFVDEKELPLVEVKNSQTYSRVLECLIIIFVIKFNREVSTRSYPGLCTSYRNRTHFM